MKLKPEELKAALDEVITYVLIIIHGKTESIISDAKSCLRELLDSLDREDNNWVIATLADWMRGSVTV